MPESPLCQMVSVEPYTNFQSPNESSVVYPFHVKHHLLYVCVWIPQSSLIWSLIQYALAKTTLPWQFPVFLYLSILISYSCLSSGYLSLPPERSLSPVPPGDLYLTLFVFDIFNQFSPHPYSWSSIGSLNTLNSDAIRKTQGKGLRHCL